MVKLELPIRTVSESNNRDHWRLKNIRRQDQRRSVYYAWRATVRRKPTLPCTVKLTRLGPKLWDDDNNVGGFKAIRDVVSELIGVDDGSDQIKFVYEQEVRPKHGILIEVMAG